MLSSGSGVQGDKRKLSEHEVTDSNLTETEAEAQAAGQGPRGLSLPVKSRGMRWTHPLGPLCPDSSASHVLLTPLGRGRSQSSSFSILSS